MAAKKKVLKRKVIVLRRRGSTVSITALQKKLRELNSGSLKSAVSVAPAALEKILLAA